MFAQSARYYDLIYAGKDYGAEAARIVEVVEAESQTRGRRLLDVACGSGLHLAHLKSSFEAEGLDLCAELLAVAREHHPDLRFHEGDMRAFDLGARFDVLTCLFSSIGYLVTLDAVRDAFACFRRHLEPGGLALVEPWFTPAQWHPDTLHAILVDEPELKIARLSTSRQDGRLSWVDLHYLVATPEGTEHFMERHELGLFETRELLAAFEDAGFRARFDEAGLSGRGLLIGVNAP